MASIREVKFYSLEGADFPHVLIEGKTRFEIDQMQINQFLSKIDKKPRSPEEIPREVRIAYEDMKEICSDYPNDRELEAKLKMYGEILGLK